jgi:hypothetical protein
LSVTCYRSVVFSTNKTDLHDILKYFLKVAFNTINQQTIDFYALKQTSFSPIKRLLDRTEFVKAQIGVHFVEHHMNWAVIKKTFNRYMEIQHKIPFGEITITCYIKEFYISKECWIKNMLGKYRVHSRKY